MRHIIEFDANLDDESLHIAAQQLYDSGVKLLLEHSASIDFPGTLLSGGRTPLGELCGAADPDENPAELQKTIKTFVRARPELHKLTEGKSVIHLALDNESPLSMTTALLSVYHALRGSLNDDFNIYRSSNGHCYSLTMYVRHYKCRHPFFQRCLTSGRKCCELPDCRAPALETLLRAHGCRDRFWIKSAGAVQPPDACGLPQHIIDLQDRVEENRRRQEDEERRRNEEASRQRAKQEALDAEAAANRERRRKALAIEEEARQAEARAKKLELDTRNAEDHAEQERRRKRFAEEQDQLDSAAERELGRTERRDQKMLSTMRESAAITKDILRERTKLVDRTSELMREVQISGVGSQAAVRVLGEIGEDRRLTDV